MKLVKGLIVNLLTAVALIVALLLVAVGYSDRVPPGVHPWVACAGMSMLAVMILNIAMLLVMLSVKWKRAWIPLAAFVVAYQPIRTFMPLRLPATDDGGPGCLRVMTYNVCGYGGNFKYEQAIDTVTAYIMAQNADVVCIQEEQCTKFKPVERWQELYPYNDTLIVSYTNASTYNAVGLHTRLPIIRKERID